MAIVVDIDPLYTNGTYLPPEPGKKKRRAIIFIVVAILVLAAAVFFALQHHQHAATTPRPVTTTNKPKPKQGQPSSNASNAVPTTESTPTTPEENSSFSNLIENDDNPTHIQYTVTSGSSPIDDWYIVHVTATNSYGTFDQLAVIHQDIDGTPDVVAGPTTSFSRSYLESQDAPEEVINQLPVYDDTSQ